MVRNVLWYHITIIHARRKIAWVPKRITFGKQRMKKCLNTLRPGGQKYFIVRFVPCVDSMARKMYVNTKSYDGWLYTILHQRWKMIYICTKHHTGYHQYPLPVAQKWDRRILLLKTFLILPILRFQDGTLYQRPLLPNRLVRNEGLCDSIE